MQGLKDFIPTEKKVAYLNALLRVGFDVLDLGSFVSPKAIPQMADTAEVIPQLETAGSRSQLSVIVANERGARDACQFEQIDILGYPFSISETFQQRNTNANIAQSLERVRAIREIAREHGKALLIYLSMGFGNPYGDIWNAEVVEQWVSRLAAMEIARFSLADTVGMATPDSIGYIFGEIVPAFTQLQFSAHFHTRPDNWQEKIEAAFANGCRHFESALKGYGGCPMAKDELVGNMATENLLFYFKGKDLPLHLDESALWEAQALALEIFPG